jgi:hypothetical protein
MYIELVVTDRYGSVLAMHRRWWLDRDGLLVRVMNDRVISRRALRLERTSGAVNNALMIGSRLDIVDTELWICFASNGHARIVVNWYLYDVFDIFGIVHCV